MQPASLYQNPLWPDAEWDVSGAFVNDRELVAFFDYCKLLLGFEPFHIVHGAPLCEWNSGRVHKHLMRDAEEIRTAGLEYEARNIAVYLTFTNLLLKEQHIKDGTPLRRRRDGHKGKMSEKKKAAFAKQRAAKAKKK